MENNDNLFNAAMIGENHGTAFILEGKRLHAVEKRVAEQQADKSNPKLILPFFREALKALILFAQKDTKVESHFLEFDWKFNQGKPDELKTLAHAIHNVYSHLPHQFRNELSSLIHHKQTG